MRLLFVSNAAMSVIFCRSQNERPRLKTTEMMLHINSLAASLFAHCQIIVYISRIAGLNVLSARNLVLVTSWLLVKML